MNNQTFDLSQLNGNNGFAINGIESGDSLRVISNVGDVNGDGFDDLILGSSNSGDYVYYTGTPGAAYLIFGRAGGFDASIELSDLDGSNGFSFSGDVSRSPSVGIDVGGADINGDGFDDLLIGSVGFAGYYYYSPPVSEAYVIYGKETGFDANLDPSDLNGSIGFTIAEGDLNKTSISGIGDLNGDGIEDFAIAGTPDDSSPIEDMGVNILSLYEKPVFVVFGREDGFGSNFDLTTIDGNNGFVVRDILETDFYSTAIDRAGDFNGDGIDDLIIGAGRSQLDGQVRSGSAFVIFGQTTGFDPNLSIENLDGSNGFLITGINDSDRFGDKVSSAGDVNGDGFDDIIVNAPLSDRNGTLSGEAYVIFGRGDEITRDFDLTTLNGDNGFRIETTQAHNVLGNGISGGGDINGDGFDDLIVGSDGEEINENSAGATYVIFGKANGFTPVLEVSSLDGNNGFVIPGLNDTDLAGRFVSNLEDINGDGLDDFAISAYRADPNGRNDAGQIYVVFGFDDSVSEPIRGTSSPDIINGTPEADLIEALAGNDTVESFTGNDTLLGGNGSDFLLGSSGNDLIVGENGNDLLVGGNDNDTLIGGAGNDTLRGGNGNDLLIGGSKTDVLFGNGGNDLFAIEKLSQSDRVIIRDYTDGTDLLGLTNGLTFGELTIEHNSSNTDILIKDTSSQITLAVLRNIDSSVTIDSDDFTAI